MKQTTAFKNFTERIQEIFNFAVLITISVPVLKNNIRLIKNGTIDRLPDPDYFEPSVVYEITDKTIQELSTNGLDVPYIERLKELLNKPLNNADFKAKVIDIIGEENHKTYRITLKKQSKGYIDNIQNCTSNYQSKLATYLYFSTFSYFEAFIGDLANEMIGSLATNDNSLYQQSYTINEANLADYNKIDKPYDGRKIDRYKKYSSKLFEQGYKIPETVLFSSTIELLKSKIENMKANEIPEVLDKIFIFKMTEDEKNTYHSIRDKRNSIGHGNMGYTPNLTDVITANKFFKDLSYRIDKHTNFYFFKPQNLTT